MKGGERVRVAWVAVGQMDQETDMYDARGVVDGPIIHEGVVSAVAGPDVTVLLDDGRRFCAFRDQLVLLSAIDLLGELAP